MPIKTYCILLLLIITDFKFSLGLRMAESTQCTKGSISLQQLKTVLSRRATNRRGILPAVHV